MLDAAKQAFRSRGRVRVRVSCRVHKSIRCSKRLGAESQP
jgi:hypothetical protein